MNPPPIGSSATTFTEVLDRTPPPGTYPPVEDWACVSALELARVTSSHRCPARRTCARRSIPDVRTGLGPSGLRPLADRSDGGRRRHRRTGPLLSSRLLPERLRVPSRLRLSAPYGMDTAIGAPARSAASSIISDDDLEQPSQAAGQARGGRRSLRRSNAIRSTSTRAVSNSCSGVLRRRCSKAVTISCLVRPLTAMMNGIPNRSR